MKKFIFSLVILVASLSCGENEPPNNFFPVLSYIQSQVAHVDSSLYTIIKVVSSDTRTDTIYIARDQFRDEAKEFLSIPDLTNNKHGKKYREEKNYDETIGRVVMTYLPVKENLEITKQEVVILPSFGGVDKVKLIIIDKLYSYKDSTVTKRLLWQVDQSFQVVTIVDRDQTSSTTKTEIIWNKPLEEQVIIPQADSTLKPPE